MAGAFLWPEKYYKNYIIGYCSSEIIQDKIEKKKWVWLMIVSINNSLCKD